MSRTLILVASAFLVLIAVLLAFSLSYRGHQIISAALLIYGLFTLWRVVKVMGE